MMQHHAQIGPVLSFSKHMHGNTLVERIDQILLDALVFFVIERVDLYDLAENFFIARVDFRHRVGDDRVAVLVILDIAVYNLARLVLESDTELLLALI